MLLTSKAAKSVSAMLKDLRDQWQVEYYDQRGKLTPDFSECDRINDEIEILESDLESIESDEEYLENQRLFYAEWDRYTQRDLDDYINGSACELV